jgi:hypothetical protein
VLSSLLRGRFARPIVSVQAPKPVQLTANRVLGKVIRIGILRPELSFHGIYEVRRLIIAPFRQVRDVKRDKHAGRRQFLSVT